MKIPRNHPLRLWLLPAALPLLTAFTPHGDAYTKRVETTFLSEPRALAKAVGKTGLNRKLKVEAVQGNWVRVNDGKISGWVFNGNLAEQKPEVIKDSKGEPLDASATLATTAARPLLPAATDYANRRNLGKAEDDLTWLNARPAVTNEQVDEFLKTSKKGEFQ
jgi:hypothetical protein